MKLWRADQTEENFWVLLQTNQQLVNGEITPHHTIARLVLLDFANYLIYYTCKKVTYELLTYEYNYWRRADESVLLP